MLHTILRLPTVKTRTGLSRSTIYLRIAQGTFPKPVNLGGRAVGWLEAVTVAIDELGEALEEHIFVTEGKNGMLAEILDVAPRLAMEIELIEEEHAGLEESLAQAQLTLRGAMEIGFSDPEPSRSRVMTLLGRLSLHRQRGADLVYEAYNVDIASVD